jgi:TDG/mug DNA glycosylase family protein
MRKHFDRFNGVTEQELYQRSLDDVVAYNLDIIVVNINPGLYSVHKGHHYSGPGNHFWRCLSQSGLTDRILKSGEDRQVLEFGVGLMNMSEKPNVKSCQDLTPDEMKEASANLDAKIKRYNPKVVAFNGKTIFEIYTGRPVNNLKFNFGKQPTKFGNDTTDIIQFVMPSSSARCSQLPKVVDKVPFYLALKKLKDHLNGLRPFLSDLDIMFPDFKVALDSSNKSAEADDSYDPTLEDTPVETPHNNNNNHSTQNRTIRFVRLNNMPYSDLPKEILETLNTQRMQKKSITITTKNNLFNPANIMKISEPTYQQNLLLGQTTPRQIHNLTLKSSSNSIKAMAPTLTLATTVPMCHSDLDTASTATNDSSSDFDSVQSFNMETHNNNINGNSMLQSRLSSIILGVCGATLNANQQQNSVWPTNATTTTPTNTTSITNITGGTTPFMPKSIVKVNKSTTVGLLLPKTTNMQPTPVISIPPATNNATTTTTTTHNTPLRIETPPPPPTASQNPENDILYELIRIDRYCNTSDFYTYETHSQNNHNHESLNSDLNRIIRLEYDDVFDSTNLYQDAQPNRSFSNINEATSYLFNMTSSHSHKRQCRIDLNSF